MKASIVIHQVQYKLQILDFLKENHQEDVMSPL